MYRSIEAAVMFIIVTLVIEIIGEVPVLINIVIRYCHAFRHWHVICENTYLL